MSFAVIKPGIPWTPELDKSFQLCKDSHSIQQYVVESGQPIVLSLSSREPNKYVGLHITEKL